MTIGRWVHEGEALPLHYGVAWYDPMARRAWCLPVPCHRLVGRVRAWYLRLRQPIEDDPVLLAYQYGETEGFRRGDKAGYETAMRHTDVLVRELKREVVGIRAQIVKENGASPSSSSTPNPEDPHAE